MTRLRCLAIAVILVAGTVAHAQDLTGSWQGTLQAGKELRLVFVVTRADGGALAATMYSIDQGAQGLAAQSVTLQDRTVRIALPTLDGAFQGTLSPDGESIAGTWSQGPGSLPLTLRRATPATAWTLPTPPAPMAADAPAVFDVASIKPSNPDAPGKLFTVKGRQVLTINTTLNDLISVAYDVHQGQIEGAPAWAATDKFDITGQPQAEGVPNQQQLRAMIRQLLADRFQLQFHRETKEMPVYAVRVDGQPKLTANTANPNGLPSLLFKGLGILPAVNATMADFARAMQTAVLDRPVVDQTGIEGRYDFTLRWTPDDSQFRSMGVRVPPPTDDPNAPPGLFTAVREQLGLRIEPARAPAEVLVIDRVERPSEN